MVTDLSGRYKEGRKQATPIPIAYENNINHSGVVLLPEEDAIVGYGVTE